MTVRLGTTVVAGGNRHTATKLIKKPIPAPVPPFQQYRGWEK